MANQKDTAPIGTVEAILKAAPADLAEDIVEVPEWGCSVKIRTLTAAGSAAVKQAGITGVAAGNPDMAWAELEKAQFLHGVVEPKFTAEQVAELFENSGSGFARVIAAHDALGGTEKEELRKARSEFHDGQ